MDTPNKLKSRAFEMPQNDPYIAPIQQLERELEEAKFGMGTICDNEAVLLQKELQLEAYHRLHEVFLRKLGIEP